MGEISAAVCAPQAENARLGSQLDAARGRVLQMNGAYDLAAAASHVGGARTAERELAAARHGHRPGRREGLRS